MARFRTVEVTFDKLNTIFKWLAQLDRDKKDFQITMKEYSSIKDNSEIMRNLVGSRKYDDWNIFKESFITYQEQYGIMWIPMQGKGGPVGLQTIALPGNLGEELAKAIIDKVDLKIDPSVNDEDVKNELKNKNNLHFHLKDLLPNLYDYLGDRRRLIDLSDFKEGFKSFTKGNYSFKFKQGKSSSFIKTINEYTFQKNESQDEVELGNQIVDKIRDLLNLDELDHVQLERRGGRFQNYDFIGYKKKSSPRSDDLILYTFELKASNKIVSISEAISQATNYKSTSHFVYIVIPMFDKKLFHDEKRFETIRDLCQGNGIGIITVEFETKKNKILDIYEVLSPKQNEILDYTLVDQILIDKDFEYCQLCNRLASKSEDRNGCGWVVSIENDSKCMKKLFEERLIKLS